MGAGVGARARARVSAGVRGGLPRRAPAGPRPGAARAVLSRRGPPAASAATGRGEHAPLRLLQHKTEAYWFYRFLSQVYDYIVNPGHWTTDMRASALEPARLDSGQKVCDVGGGTGFSTQGIVACGVRPGDITVLDQSDHQLAKAKAKPDLEGCTFLTGDAEDLPFADGTFDRYVSCGSIEYWPEPQRGIAEAYRVVRKGGTACVVGPVRPTYALSRAMADLWMLFPEEDEYLEWFKRAGFENVKLTRIGPKWYRGERGHGLIMGCSVTGVRPLSGKPPLDLGPKREDRSKKGPNPLASLLRLLVGTIGGFYYFLVPVSSPVLPPRPPPPPPPPPPRPPQPRPPPAPRPGPALSPGAARHSDLTRTVPPPKKQKCRFTCG